jgi:uracil-DNA glycosylase
VSLVIGTSFLDSACTRGRDSAGREPYDTMSTLRRIDQVGQLGGVTGLGMGDVLDVIPIDWRSRLAHAANDPRFARTLQSVEQRRATATVYPPADQTFAALQQTAPDAVRVVILGQDPYPGAGQANGLAFSVAPGMKIPPSLRNILRSLRPDLSYVAPASGSLEPWAQQGVLLLNTILTVESGKPGSHKDLGWQTFTDDVFRAVNDSPETVVFLLWGEHAQAKVGLVTSPRHMVLTTSHPSPLSAWRGFLQDRPLRAANEALRRAGRPEIDWSLP